jgi:aminopeptidase N
VGDPATASVAFPPQPLPTLLTVPCAHLQIEVLRRLVESALIAGEPEVAANWYPVNDHPLDKASYTFEVTVPAGLQVIANGRLVGHRTKAGNTTSTWEAREPMASYLATASVGHYALHS